MFWDWVLREGWLLPLWWGLISIAGLTVLPLCWRFLGNLPDQGYTLARALGLLLIALVYWLLASYGLLANSVAGILSAWLLVLLVSAISYITQADRPDIMHYWRSNQRLIIVAEILFLLCFTLMLIYRAYQNDTFTTEKPMEMAFISSIMRSESFPPNDPWLAGYAISYYYLGYVITAMLTMLSNLHSGYGFSMMIASVYALIALSAFGLIYNLVRARLGNIARTTSQTSALVTGVLGVVLLLLMGNFQFALVEMPYRAQSAPASYLEWWGMRGFTDMDALNYQQTNPPSTLSTPLTDPQTWAASGWWWWHTSRILEDYDINGNPQEIIDEVPAFSFILMDLHPHILALPFAILALALALNFLLLNRAPNNAEIIFCGIVIGGLFFLNTWDAPIYGIILIAAQALRRLIHNRGTLLWTDWRALFRLGAFLMGVTVLVYLPFLISFRSQAGGIIPNILAPTPLRLYFLMFGPLLLLAIPLLITQTQQSQRARQMNWALGIQVASGIMLSFVALLTVVLILALILPNTQSYVQELVQAAGSWNALLGVILGRRLRGLLLLMLLFIGFVIIVARLFPRHLKSDQPFPYTPSAGFALLLLAAAIGITLVPEFIYLRDRFGTRINTIFKFYYQAWLLLSIVSAYACHRLLFASSKQWIRTAYALLLTVILLLCVPYSFFGMFHRAVIEQGRHTLPIASQAPLTLDGRADGLSAEYFATVQCLGNLIQGDDVLITEASQQTYNSQYGRMGAFYGIPTLINWENHQIQWRGATYTQAAGTRRTDVDRLYTDLRWQEVVPIIDQYGIDYIVYGQTERTQYGARGEDKFSDHLGTVCEFGNVRVYAVSPSQLAQDRATQP